MIMAIVQELVDLLVRALHDRPGRVEHVKRFQEAVWSTENLQAELENVRLLRDLAYDLDFYEPDDQARADSPASYGDARLEEEIRSALQQLTEADLSLKVPHA
jgi:hypothetical protein